MLEEPHSSALNEYQQHMFFCEEIRVLLCEYPLLSGTMTHMHLPVFTTTWDILFIMIICFVCI